MKTFLKVVSTGLLIWALAPGAMAQDQYTVQKGVDLWGGLKTGMTKEEVEDEGLDEKFELSQGCRVKLKTFFRNDVLHSLAIRARWDRAHNTCGALVRRSLSAKYGKSIDAAPKRDAYAPMRRTYLEEKWLTEELIITLGHSPSDGRFYYVNYEPRLIKREADLIDSL